MDDVQQKKSDKNQISESRFALVQACWKIVESALYNQMDLRSTSLGEPGEIHEPAYVQCIRKKFDAIMEANNISKITTHADSTIDWDKVPPSLKPEGGELNGLRAANKKKQVQALMHAILPVIDTLSAMKSDGNVHVVDIGAGSGHVGLVLAWMRPNTCRVSLLERKEYCCRQAERRALKAGLSNINIANVNLHTFCDYRCGESGANEVTNEAKGFIGGAAVPFDLAISLHSCGVLTDAALEMCVYQRAAFVLSPCCYGQTSSNTVLQPHMPRSEALASLRDTDMPQEWKSMKRGKRKLFRNNETPKPFNLVARSADCTAPVDGEKSFVFTRNFKVAKRCMQLVDMDRILWMCEYGYFGKISSIIPLEVSPKNSLIIGIPKDHFAGESFSTRQFDVRHFPTLALDACVHENRAAEAGEKELERQRIKAAQEAWKRQFKEVLAEHVDFE